MGSGDSHWAHHTTGLQGFAYRFAVRSDDERLGRQVESLLGSLRAEGEVAAEPVEHWYSLTAAAGGVERTIGVVRDGEPVALASSPGDAVAWLMWDINRAVADAGRDHLVFHAAGLCAGDAGVLVPGPSGSGKSTLAAGLVRAGFAYLSDELVALEIDGGRLLPYAKPITVKPGSSEILRDMRPALGGAEDRWGADEWLLAVGDDVGRPVGGPCAPALVVVPRYVPGGVTQLMPLSETEAFVALAFNVVNFADHGADGVRALGDLVTRCENVGLTMSDLDEAVELVGGLLPGVAVKGQGVARGAGLAE